MNQSCELTPLQRAIAGANETEQTTMPPYDAAEMRVVGYALQMLFDPSSRSQWSATFWGAPIAPADGFEPPAQLLPPP